MQWWIHLGQHVTVLYSFSHWFKVRPCDHASKGYGWSTRTITFVCKLKLRTQRSKNESLSSLPSPRPWTLLFFPDPPLAMTDDYSKPTDSPCALTSCNEQCRCLYLTCHWLDLVDSFSLFLIPPWLFSCFSSIFLWSTGQHTSLPSQVPAHHQFNYQRPYFWWRISISSQGKVGLYCMCYYEYSPHRAVLSLLFIAKRRQRLCIWSTYTTGQACSKREWYNALLCPWYHQSRSGVMDYTCSFEWR